MPTSILVDFTLRSVVPVPSVTAMISSDWKWRIRLILSRCGRTRFDS
jgi:hypothetical protein